jgi:SAM-dependent methyltransferase
VADEVPLILGQRLRRLARRMLRAVDERAGTALLGGRGVLANRFLSGKLLPLSPDASYSLLARTGASQLHEGLPAPPRQLWERWGSTLDSYLRGGGLDSSRILGDLAGLGVTDEALKRVLDFGCAEGRVLRFFPRLDERELWGVDVNAERIAWCQQNLSPPLRFATTTTAPHLPFSDAFFDLVYAISVFTHISELADAWLLELLRVVRPGGHLYLTIHDEHTVELILGEAATKEPARELNKLLRQFHAETGGLSRDWIYFAVHADPSAQVFYRSDELVRRWSLLAEVIAVKPEAIGYQTALVLRKAGAQSHEV